jgi:hypothetical protein
VTLRAEEVASRYAFSRPSSRLLGYQDVGLPYYWLTLDGIVQERKALSPIDEFVLLAIRSGLDHPDAITAFLGLDEALVKRSLVEQLNGDVVDWSPRLSGEQRELRLTERGTQVVAEMATIEPKQTPLYVAFDRMTWEVTPLRKEDLLRPRELREAGWREIGWKRARQPLASELPLRRVDQALIARGFQRPEDEEIRSEILAITGVSRAERWYRPAVMLVFQDDGQAQGSGVDLALIVDGRLSEGHTNLFEQLDQAKSIQVEREEEETEPLPDDLDRRRAEAVNEVLRQHERASRARERIANAVPAIDGPEAGTDLIGARVELQEAVQTISSFEVRPLQVWEHPPLLRDALSNARGRLLIISPWIRDAVVDVTFLDALSRCLERGVRVHLGYGIAAKERERQKNDVSAEKALQGLAGRYPTFTFRRLGDTHAKILVCDDFIVTTSFNWLSYQGDPNRTFRQEEGVFIRRTDYVDREYERHVARIEAASDSGNE